MLQDIQREIDKICTFTSFLVCPNPRFGENFRKKRYIFSTYCLDMGLKFSEKNVFTLKLKKKIKLFLRTVGFFLMGYANPSKSLPEKSLDSSEFFFLITGRP